jgi:hypothetical protein
MPQYPNAGGALGPATGAISSFAPTNLILSAWNLRFEWVPLWVSSKDYTSSLRNTILTAGLALYKIPAGGNNAGLFTGVDPRTLITSPDQYASPNLVPLLAGILMDSIDMLEDGVAVQRHCKLIRSGHLNSALIHGADGTAATKGRILEHIRGSVAHQNGVNIQLDVTTISPGQAVANSPTFS